MKSRHLPETSGDASDEAGKSPLAGELLDLYAATLIVVLLTLFIRSLWP